MNGEVSHFSIMEINTVVEFTIHSCRTSLIYGTRYKRHDTNKTWQTLDSDISATTVI